MEVSEYEKDGMEKMTVIVENGSDRSGSDYLWIPW